MRRLLGHLWAGPLTALGFGVAAILGARLHGVRDGALEMVAPARGPLALFFRLAHVSAYTWGATIVFRDEALTRLSWLAKHERVHVQQAMVLGVLLPIAYVAASLWALFRGKHFYRDNWFEVLARRGEG